MIPAQLRLCMFDSNCSNASLPLFMIVHKTWAVVAGILPSCMFRLHTAGSSGSTLVIIYIYYYRYDIIFEDINIQCTECNSLIIFL